jgi:hypothetical protein
VFGATYEDFRRRILTGAAGGSASGLVLCLREGLAAWMTHGAMGAGPVAPAGQPERCAAPRVSNEIHAAVVRVLASMALDRVKETPP